MTEDRGQYGSALILAVVLTSLLAMVGVTFLLVSRVDKIATSSVTENKELELAVESVIAKIAEELARDVPGEPNQEYQDYPMHRVDVGDDGILGTADDSLIENWGFDGVRGTADDVTYYNINDDIWLASFEPYKVNVGEYYWRHISDVYGRLAYLFEDNIFDKDSDRISFQNIRAVIIEPTETIEFEGQKADADGDGVADSRWVQIPDMSSKGQPVYAAVRIIDNSAMINVNTATFFDPNLLDEGWVDGSSQMQIDLEELARGTGPTRDKIDYIISARGGLGGYQDEVIWKLEKPNTYYTPFDISDELVLRNRYIIDQNDTVTRLKSVWPKTFDRGGAYGKDTPYDNTSALSAWFNKTGNGYSAYYIPRHLVTTYNMDRIINPYGRKMANISKADKDTIFSAIRAGFADAGVDNDDLAAQIAVNIRDYSDEDSQVSSLNGRYGFELPCLYLSELAARFKRSSDYRGRRVVYRSYGIELFKRYGAEDFSGWRLLVDNSTNPDFDDYEMSFDSGDFPARYYVLLFNDPNADLSGVVDFDDSDNPEDWTPYDGETGVDPNVILWWPGSSDADGYDVYLGTDEKSVKDANTTNDPNGVYWGWRPQSDPNFYPGPLDHNETYFWRVDIVDANGDVIGVANPLWSFTTRAAEPEIIFYDDSNYNPGDIVFDANTVIHLLRQDEDGGEIVVDSFTVPQDWWVIPEPNMGKDVDYYVNYQRDIRQHRCLHRSWGGRIDVNDSNNLTLGHYNGYVDNTYAPLQGFPYKFNNVGEIGRIFTEPVYWELGQDPCAVGVIGYAYHNEEDVRVDLTWPRYQALFRYLTLFDPTTDGIDNDGDLAEDGADVIGPELKVPGRININTAPWYVIAQLPWVSQREGGYRHEGLAKAIVNYRDKLGIYTDEDTTYPGDGRFQGTAIAGLREYPGFASIGELMTVVDVNADDDPNYDMHYYAWDSNDQFGFPDLTTSRRDGGDDVTNDFEERDLIFARISDLVTVRSDVFTAYILVRLGTDGPQKRVIAILDRSDVYSDEAGGLIGNVKIRALHPVPDPR